MKKYFILFVLGFMLSILAQPAVGMEPGFYLTADIGYGQADMNDVGWRNVDDTDRAFSFGIGYLFNQYIAVEGGYLDAGSYSLNSTVPFRGSFIGKPITATGNTYGEAETDGFYLGPALSLPVTENFKIYARGGGYFWDSHIEVYSSNPMTYNGVTYGSNVKAAHDDNDADLYYGAGISYDLNKTVAIKANFTRYDLNNFDIDIISLGFIVRLGNLF